LRPFLLHCSQSYPAKDAAVPPYVTGLSIVELRWRYDGAPRTA
jgi:hypothetical protein